MAYSVGVTVRYDVWTDRKYAQDRMKFDWIGWTLFRTTESLSRCLPTVCGGVPQTNNNTTTTPKPVDDNEQSHGLKGDVKALMKQIMIVTKDKRVTIGYDQNKKKNNVRDT